MKAHSLQVIGDKTEEELITWRNEKVEDDLTVKSLKDKKFCNSLYFINIMKTIEPRSINWDNVVTDKEDESNAKNVISYDKLYLNFEIPCLSNNIFNLFYFSSIILILKL